MSRTMESNFNTSTTSVTNTTDTSTTGTLSNPGSFISFATPVFGGMVTGFTNGASTSGPSVREMYTNLTAPVNTQWRIPVLPYAMEGQNANFQKLLDSLPAKLAVIDRTPRRRVCICLKDEYRTDQMVILRELATRYGYKYQIIPNNNQNDGPLYIYFAV